MREVSELVVQPAQLTLQAGSEGWLAAQANDSAGQPIGGAILRYQSADPRVLRVTDAGGVLALGPASAGTNVVVTSGSRERRVPVTVLPGPPQRIERLEGDGQQVLSGEEVRDPLVARLLDAFGNPLENEQVVIESSAGLFEPATATSGPGGVVSFQLPALTRAGTALVAMRVRGAAAAAESFSVQVLPAAPASIEAASAAPGEPLGLVVADAFGNPVPNVEVTARFAGTDADPLVLRTDALGLVTVPAPDGLAGGPTTVEVGVAGGALHRTIAWPSPPAVDGPGP
ncbi:MAG: Ig-like domain-containing protein [Vicinamibacterales bacterium]|nr:Ig-like domain-containing protein [Vicinamibacterales bacterium]